MGFGRDFDTVLLGFGISWGGGEALRVLLSDSPTRRQGIILRGVQRDSPPDMEDGMAGTVCSPRMQSLRPNPIPVRRTNDGANFHQSRATTQNGTTEQMRANELQNALEKLSEAINETEAVLDSRKRKSGVSPQDRNLREGKRGQFLRSLIWKALVRAYWAAITVNPED